MAGAAAGFPGVAKIAENLGGLDVDGSFSLELVLLAAGDERKHVDALVRVRERDIDAGKMPLVMRGNAPSVQA
jgi:hypothetical protein